MIKYFFLLLFSSAVFADSETVPAVQQFVSPLLRYQSTLYSVGYHESVQAVCDAVVARSPGTGPATVYTTVDGSSCYNVNGAYLGMAVGIYRCSDGSAPVNNNQCSVLSCPDNSWTLNGNICTRLACPSGQYASGNQCLCANGAQVGSDGVTCCPMVGDGNAGAAMQWCWVGSPSASTCDSTGSNGCAVRCNNVTFQKGDPNSVQIFPRQALGQSCTYTGSKAVESLGGGELTNDQLKAVDEATKDPAKADSPEGCLASGQGYVTGSSGTKCVPSGDTGVVKKETSSNVATDSANNKTTSEQTKQYEAGPNGTGIETTTETVTNPDGSKTKTTTTTQKNPDGTVTESKTSETFNPDGSKSGEETSKSDDPADDYCSDNPDSVLCKGFSDPCKEFPDSRLCRVGEIAPKGSFSDNSGRVDVARQAFADYFADVRSEASGLLGSVSGGGGSLPCPPSITVLGHSVQICASKYSSELSGIGSVLVAVATLVAAMIIFRR